jgi:succinate dehydrogenase / fumarate reductase, cytochrome b subunit
MQTAADKRHYWLRKLHSLTGVLPIGGYLFFHLFENAGILVSGELFERNALFIESFGFLIAPVEALLIGSLLFHGVYGLFIVADARPNIARYPIPRNWFFLFQRVTGVMALLFIGYHVWDTRIEFYRGQMSGEHVAVTARWMGQNIWGIGAANAITGAAYIAGAIASSMHLCNGLWSFLIKWGITVGPTSQRVSSWVWNGLGVLMSVAFVMVALKFRTFA